jgi:DinB family protein
MELDLRYPIGKFETPKSVDASTRDTFIAQIEAAPRLLRKAVARLDSRQLDTPYRPGGWTVRQVVHHLPDSHINAYVRFKLALTEDTPTIRPYEEALWAKLPEATSGEIALSLALLDAVHARWLACIRTLPGESFDREYRHPESGLFSLNQQLALYAWHGRHHVAHITSLAGREGWTT